MNTSITARELFEQQRERLGLRWAAGKSGEKRELEAGNTVSRRPSLAGYLNAIYPNKGRSWAPRNCPGWMRWNRASVGRPSKRSCSRTRWRWC